MKDIIELINQAKEQENLPKYVADHFRAFPPLYGYETIANDLKSLNSEVLDVKETIKVNSTCTCSRSPTNITAEIETLKEEIIEIKQFIMDFVTKSKVDKKNKNMNKIAELSFVSSSTDQEFSEASAPSLSQLSQSPILLNENREKILTNSPSKSVKQKNTPIKSNKNSKVKEKPTYSLVLQNNETTSQKVVNKNQETTATNSIDNSNSTSNGNTNKRIEGNYQIDEDGFKMKIKKPRIIGTKQNNERLKAVSRTKVLYIGRLEEKTTTEDIKIHIKEELDVEIIKCYKLNCSMRKCSSFKVIIDASDVNKLMSDQAWPMGTIVHEYIYRNPDEQNNSNDIQVRNL